VSEDDKKALLDLRMTIHRWKQMLLEVEGKNNESDSTLYEICNEMTDTLHYRFYKFAWWTP
jgi:hypothetical protein